MKEDIRKGLNEAYRMLYPYRIDEEYDPEEYYPEDDPRFLARKEKEAEEARAEDIALSMAKEKWLEKKHGVDEGSIFNCPICNKATVHITDDSGKNICTICNRTGDEINEKRNKTPFEKELEDYELHLNAEPFARDKEGNETDWKYSISTPDDPSVGIFASYVAPFFKTVEELQDWWTRNKEQLITLMDKEDWDGVDKLAGNKQELNEKFGLPGEKEEKQIEDTITSLLYDLGEEASEQINKEQFDKLMYSLMDKIPFLTGGQAEYAVKVYLYKNKIPIVGEEVDEYLQKEPVPPGPKSPKPGNSLIGESKMKFTNREVMALMETSPEDIKLYKQVSEKTGLSIAHLRRMAARKEGKHVKNEDAIGPTTRGTAQDFKSGPVGKLKEDNAVFNQEKAFGVLEQFGVRDFNTIADHNYSNLDAFYKASAEFVPMSKWGKYKAALQASQTIKEDNSPAIGKSLGKIPLKRNIPQGALRPSGISENKRR